MVNNSLVQEVINGRIDDLMGADLSNSVFPNEFEFIGADLTGANLSNSILKTIFFQDCILNEANLEGSNLESIYADHIDFIGANLRNTSLKNCSLLGCDLTDADFSGSNLTRATLEQSHFSGANLSLVILTQGKLEEAVLEGANLTGSDLRGANLSSVILHEANLTGANLTGANLTGADVRDAVLSGANLTGANLTDADLTGADLTGAILTGAILTRVVGMIVGGPIPRGVAFEIHNAYDKFKKNVKKYLDIIDPIVNTPNNVYETINIVDYIQPKLQKYIQDHFSGEETPVLMGKLNAVLERFRSASEISNLSENKIVVGKTVDFVIKQPDEFIDFYIRAFIQDCYHAYNSQDNSMSCVKGILERFTLVIADAALAVCPDEECDNEVYVKLLKLFGKKVDLNEMTQLWANTHLESDSIKNMSKEERKQHYISFVKSKFEEAGLFDETADKKIKEEADKIEYVFETLEFGGSKNKKRKTMKKKTNKRKTIKKGKKNKTIKKGTKRKTIKRRNRKF